MAKIEGPRGNPERRCYGPSCENVLRRFNGQSFFWKGTARTFGYKGCNYFCSMLCATNWAVPKCDAGDDVMEASEQ